MRKQAVLIIVHKNTYVLEKNLQLLDSPYIDIFIHVDKKCSDFKYNFYKSLVKYSTIIYVKPRLSVYWASFSQVKVELLLLEAASKYSQYSYFHLISGQDLLMKPVSDLISYFDKSDKLFIEFRKLSNSNKWDKKVYQRVSVKHILIDYVRDKHVVVQYLARFLNKVYAQLQETIGIDLVRKNHIILRYGSQWFSLPYDSVKYILDKKDEIYHNYCRSWLVDEIFIQSTIATSSLFVKRLADTNKRKIRWNKNSAHPYVWRISDFDKLITTSAFFARKFDERIDKNIINKIYNYISLEMKK